MIMCSNCFNINKTNCCNNYNPVVIDNDIIDIIVKLNKLNYKTISCCSGHPMADKTICIYILFNKYYNFKILPVNFKYAKIKEKNKLYGNLWLNINIKNLSLEQQIKEINFYLNELTNWVNSLS